MRRQGFLGWSASDAPHAEHRGRGTDLVDKNVPGREDAAQQELAGERKPERIEVGLTIKTQTFNRDDDHARCGKYHHWTPVRRSTSGNENVEHGAPKQVATEMMRPERQAPGYETQDKAHRDQGDHGANNGKRLIQWSPRNP